MVRETLARFLREVIPTAEEAGIHMGIHPGYPAIGRLKGLAEIRGVMTAVASVRGLPV